MIAPPATGFRLVRYFTVASLAAFFLTASLLAYLESEGDAFFRQVLREQSLYFKQMQSGFVKQQDEAARRDLLAVYEAGNANLARLFSNALWPKDFAPFVARAQHIPVDRCHAIAEVKAADGKTVRPREKNACFAGIGKQIMALPDFQALNARVFETMKKSTVFKIKVFDLRGITVYSSEHSQIGEDKLGNAGWRSAVAGTPASQLTFRGRFSSFEGEVVDRDLISSYLPVFAPGSEKIAGVFEVYVDVTPLLAQIRNTSTQIQKLSAANEAHVEGAVTANQAAADRNSKLMLAAVIALLALFYCALFLIVRRGQRIIDKQDIGRGQAELMLRAREETLRATNQELQMLVQSSPLAIYTRDRDGLLTSWNPAAEKLYGWMASEVLGKPAPIAPQEARAASDESRLRILAGEPFEKSQSRRLRRDGAAIDIDTFLGPLRDASGNVSGVITMAADITARKQEDAARASLEAQLRESQKMQAIGTLAGGIAHDFNNVIATILGNTELARQDVSANSRVQESLEEIRKAAARGRDVVQQILSFSRRRPTERKPTALAPIVENSVRLLRAMLPARLAFAVHAAPDLPGVLADATQIEQILINLATNAMQAMQGSPGRIDIRLETVMLDAEMADTHPALRAMHATHPGRTLRIAVSDDAPGMDAATLARIFEPFFTTKPVGEGTGLGLAVVHGIVQAHEGAIVVDSRPGKGSTFTLYLPAIEAPAGAPAPEKSAAATSAAPDAARSEHILYLDDDEALVFLVTRMLQRRGYRVSGFTEQNQALTALRADPARFDLVVSDYNMPGMSGVDVARAVRAIRADLPVAVVTGFIDEALRAQAGGAGVRELIFKADAAEDLCAAIARLARAGRGKSA